MSIDKKKPSIWIAAVLLVWLLCILMPVPSYAAASSFGISGANYPEAIAQGEQFGVTGTVTSAVPLDFVKVGVVDMNTGNWVSYATYDIPSPGGTSYSISSAASHVKFYKLPAGDYTYRVWVRDTNKTSKYLLVKPFKVTGAQAASSSGAAQQTSAVSSSMSFSGGVFPSSLKQGQSFSFGGTVHSNAKIQYVSLGVTDSSGNWVDGYLVTERPDATTYDIAKSNSKIAFGNLPAGTYYFRVYVCDVNGYKKALVHSKFTVTAASTPVVSTPSKFTLSGANYPISLKAGQSFSVCGTITSAVTLNYVKVGVVDMNTGNWVSYATYNNANPNTKTFNVALASSSIGFSKLPAGDYTYRVWARDTNGTAQYLLCKSFTVTGAATPSKLTLSGANYPTSLKGGQSFSVSGTITSAVTLNYVKVGVVDMNTGSWVSYATYNNANPNTKTFNVASASSSIGFSKLPAGDYTYRVWARDTNGTAQYLLCKNFTVTGAATPSKLTLSGANYPTSLKAGQSFSVSGTITSAVTLNYVKVGVVDMKTGSWVSYATYNNANPNAKTFNVASASSSVGFAKLPAGDYTYRVWARDTNGTAQYLLCKNFTVTGAATPSKFTLSGANYPTSLTYGRSFSVSGTITSAVTLNYVKVGVVDMSTGNWVSTATYNNANPNAKTFSISTADPSIKFGTLPNGSYTYRVWVRDTNGTAQYLLCKTFTVSGGPSSPSPSNATLEGATVLPYNASLISSIGKQPYSGPCGIYCMAYARAVIDGSLSKGSYKTYQDFIINYYGLGGSYAYWSRAGGTMVVYSTESSLYKNAFSQVAAGKPCIMNCYSPSSGNNHFVLVIGYVAGTTRSNVGLGSFIVLDPATGTQRFMSETGYQSPTKTSYGPELITF